MGESDTGITKRFDEAVDAGFDPWRGKPEVDRAAAAVSNLADYGIVWVLLALLKARRRGPGRRRAVVALGAAGFSSLFMVRAVKSLVARQRPEEHLTARVRAPNNSSFPSGHTLAAFCTAYVLSESAPQTAACVGFAGAVAVSRVHLRAHHPSDVVGGAAIGAALGLALRPAVNLVVPGSGRRPRREAKATARGMGPQGYVLKRL
jgi:undecaprenyl-diphosphatase